MNFFLTIYSLWSLVGCALAAPSTATTEQSAQKDNFDFIDPSYLNQRYPPAPFYNNGDNNNLLGRPNPYSYYQQQQLTNSWPFNYQYPRPPIPYQPQSSYYLPNRFPNSQPFGIGGLFGASAGPNNYNSGGPGVFGLFEQENGGVFGPAVGAGGYGFPVGPSVLGGAGLNAGNAVSSGLGNRFSLGFIGNGITSGLAGIGRSIGRSLLRRTFGDATQASTIIKKE